MLTTVAAIAVGVKARVSNSNPLTTAIRMLDIEGPDREFSN